MQFFKTPFLALLVFGVGMGIGLAWKNGWIPVELGAANTGILGDDTGNSAGSAPPSKGPVEAAADDPDLFASQATASAASEPKADWERGEQPGRATVASGVVPDPEPAGIHLRPPPSPVFEIIDQRFKRKGPARCERDRAALLTSHGGADH